MNATTRQVLYPTLVLLLVLLAVGLFLRFFTAEAVDWRAYGAMMGFYGLIFLVGAYAATRGRNDELGDVLLAGRNLPLGVAIFTMSATWIDGGYVNGSAEYTASQGLVWVQAPWGYAISLILGGLLFARRMRRFRFTTMLDPLEQRFGKRIAALLFLPALSGEVFWTAAILTALGSTFGTIVGLDMTTAIILSALIAVAYTALGGLWAVAVTDLVQLLLLIVGLAVVVPIVVDAVGGWPAAWSAYREDLGPAASLLPSEAALGKSYWNWWDYALLLMMGGIPWQAYFQRVLAARNERTAVNLSVLAGVVCFFVAALPVTIGIVGRVADWEALGAGPPPTAAATLPWVIHHLTPAWVATIGLGAVAAAVMSSVDSSILSASSMFGWNVFRPLLRPDISPARLALVIRRSIWVIGGAATLLALNVRSVYALWFLCSDFVYCLLFPALACALFDPRANAPGALAGFLVAAVLRFGGGDATLGLPVLLPYPMVEDGVNYFPFRTLAMVSGLATIIVVSRLTARQYPPRQLRVDELTGPDPSGTGSPLRSD